MAIKQIDFGSSEYKKMVQLRLNILRKPLGLHFTDNELIKEKEDVFIAAFDEEKILGCCILTPINAGCIKLRQMAVEKNLQGKGIGVAIMSFAENLTRDRGYKVLMMHARKTALGFYEKMGYEKKGASFIEVNLEHWVMEKFL